MSINADLCIDLTVGNFFKYYIFNNYSPSLSEQDQRIARVAAIAFGVLTVCLGLIVVGLWVYDKNYEVKLFTQTSNISPQNQPQATTTQASPSKGNPLPQPPLFSTTHLVESPLPPNITAPLGPERTAYNKMKEIGALYLSKLFTIQQLKGCLAGSLYSLTSSF
ncbi:MAG TPA: hypothetical protein VIH61_06270, partial [Waddliaceae bacterium]